MEAFRPQKDHIKSLRPCSQLVTRCQRLRRAQDTGTKQGSQGLDLILIERQEECQKRTTSDTEDCSRPSVRPGGGGGGGGNPRTLA